MRTRAPIRTTHLKVGRCGSRGQPPILPDQWGLRAQLSFPRTHTHTPTGAFFQPGTAVPRPRRWRSPWLTGWGRPVKRRWGWLRLSFSSTPKNPFPRCSLGLVLSPGAHKTALRFRCRESTSSSTNKHCQRLNVASRFTASLPTRSSLRLHKR
jgi:hypothetical protein